MINENYAVVDADFFIKMTEHASDKGALFMQMMHDLGFHPVMHKFVAEKELKKSPYIKSLIDDGTIEVYDYADYLLTDQERQDYESYFLEAYEKLNRFDFPEGKDIYRYEDKGESLGEIRSAYMAKKMGYPYLMSDDGGAKLLVNAFLRKPQVMDVYTALMTCHENGTEITLKQLNPTIANVFRDKREKLKLLQERYS